MKEQFRGYVPQPGSKEPGVYQYRQPETGRVYIGSTVNEYGRFIQHTTALVRGDHPNKRFQQAYDELPSFEVEFSPLPADQRNGDVLRTVRDWEQRLIDEFPDKTKLLNIAKDVYARGRGMSPTPETRAKLSQALTGRVVSEETKRRQSEALKGQAMSPERREKISAAMSKKPVHVGEKIYKSAAEAARMLGFSSKNSINFRCRSESYPDYGFVEPNQLGHAPSM